ncbi:MAG: hypothetical protein ACRBM6_21605 [Geminicoccales bacterium]
MFETATTKVWTIGKLVALFMLLVIWFTVAVVIGDQALLTNANGSLLPPIAITAVVPVAVFLGLYANSSRFRGFVLAQDIETLTMLQLWRVIGFVFLMLYAYGVLPGLFALPAGIGDVAIGLAAPFVVLHLRRDPNYATSSGLVRFQYLGLLDFAVAIITAGLSAGAFASLTPGGVTSAPMDVWPLNLFPSFIVPIFIILHLTVLLKVRKLRRHEASPATAVTQTA